MHLLQIYKMIPNKTLFIDLFNDLSYEIEEMGYEHLEDQMELINEMLYNHFGLEVEDENQLRLLTGTIIKKQGTLDFLKML